MQFNSLNFIDIHYHANPDLYKRRYNALDAGKQYKKLQGAVVLKSHLGSTSIEASIAQQEGFLVFPSIVLNNISGGISYKSIIQCLSTYQPIHQTRVIVHLPTITGRQHQSKLSRDFVYPQYKPFLCQEETIFQSFGKVHHELENIFKMARDYPIVLSSGHASKEETLYLIDACEKYNVPSLLLNQPANPLTGLKAEDLMDLSKNSFVWFEQTALTYLLGYQSEEDFRMVLQNVPQVIYSSDLGQTSQMDIPEWLQTSEQWFVKYNISSTRKADLCLNNPINLLKV